VAVFRHSWFVLLVALSVPAVVVAQSVSSESSPARDPAPATALTLADAVGRVLRDNPSLVAAGFAVRALDARREQAAQKPAWHGTLEAENLLGTGRLSTVDALETTLRLGTVIERGDKRARRIDLVDADQALLVADQDATRLDLLAEVARRFIAVSALEQADALSREATAIARRGVSLVDERVAAAKAGEAEAGKARIALARAILAEEHTAHELASARVALAALWNAREPDFERTQAEFYDLPAPESLDALTAALDRNPRIARFATARRLEDARLALARSARAADLTINGGLRRIESLDDQGLVFSLTVPFDSPARAAPFEREAALRRDQVDYEADATRADLHRTLYALYQELLHARTQARTLRAEVIPQARRVLEHSEQGYAAGRYSYLELVDARQQLLGARREAVDAARDYHLYFVELERMTGRALGVNATEVSP
jgi:cobalt-zinc-cadmium efflux system outer membrane protein